jgi:hypothetical protein
VRVISHFSFAQHQLDVMISSVSVSLLLLLLALKLQLNWGGGGLGRIGRIVFRNALELHGIDIVGINE